MRLLGQKHIPSLDEHPAVLRLEGRIADLRRERDKDRARRAQLERERADAQTAVREAEIAALVDGSAASVEPMRDRLKVITATVAELVEAEALQNEALQRLESRREQVREEAWRDIEPAVRAQHRKLCEQLAKDLRNARVANEQLRTFLGAHGRALAVPFGDLSSILALVDDPQDARFHSVYSGWCREASALGYDIP